MSNEPEALRGWRSVFAWPLLMLVKGYQRLISPLLPASCRFYPSCSAYAVTALTRFGPIKGTWLAGRRLARCHPWNPGGVDHVPPREVSSRENARSARQSSAAKANLGGE